MVAKINAVRVSGTSKVDSTSRFRVLRKQECPSAESASISLESIELMPIQQVDTSRSLTRLQGHLLNRHQNHLKDVCDPDGLTALRSKG